MKKINISQVDTVFVNGSYPIEFLFFYKNKIQTAKIRKALKKLSVSFWPVFGVYNDGCILAAKFSEDNYFRETVYNEDFDSAQDEIVLWEKFSPVNDRATGLFFLSVLQFNNGTVLIPKMNHMLGDGYSYFYFLAVLAALTGSSILKSYAIRFAAKPEIQRTILKDFHFKKTHIEQPVVNQKFTIKTEKMLKSQVNQEIKAIKSAYNASVSANDILSAHIFKTLYEKQKDQLKERFSLSIPIDVRRQVKGMGAEFFGNGLMFHNYNLALSEIEETDAGQLAMRFRNSMPEINTESYLKYLSDLESKIEKSPVHNLKPYNPERGCLVTNLSRMPAQKLNFGTGNPDFIFTLTIGHNSVAILADNHNFLLRLVY